MPPIVEPLEDTQLRAYESKRDLAAELLESVRQMKAGKTQAVFSPSRGPIPMRCPLLQANERGRHDESFQSSGFSAH